MTEYSEQNIIKLSESILQSIKGTPMRFYDVLREYDDPFRKITLAWSKLIEEDKIFQDQFGFWHQMSEKEKMERYDRSFIYGPTAGPPPY
jgi:hypothetical protein